MKTDIALDARLADVQNLIYKQAWKASERYKLPFDECLSECYWDFVRATNWKFKPERGVKFSTYLQFLIQIHFRTLLRKRIERDKRFPMSQLNEATAGSVPAQHSPALEAVEGMSTEAREIVNLLVDTPRELLDVWDPVSPKELLRRVKEHLHCKGHSKPKLDQAHKELETKLRILWAGNELEAV